MEEKWNETDGDIDDGIIKKIMALSTRNFKVSFLVIFIVGLLIGSIFSIAFLYESSLNDDASGAESDNADSDGDGVSDHDEMSYYGTDPEDSNDMMVTTGLLICHKSLNGMVYGEGGGSAMIITENDQHNIKIIPVSTTKDEKRAIWGSFTLKNQTEQIWKIVNENTSVYNDLNSEMTITSSVSWVFNGKSLGYGIEENVIWFSLEEKPSLFNEIQLKGVSINGTLARKIIPLLGFDLSLNLGLIQDLNDSEIDMDSISFYMAESVIYPYKMELEGDVIKQWEWEKTIEKHMAEASVEEFSMIERYSSFLLKEKSSDHKLWTIMYPLSMGPLELKSVVNMGDIVPLNVEALPFLSEIQPMSSDDVNINFGLMVSREISNEYYERIIVPAACRII